MASSSLITSINSALDDVDFLLLHFSKTVWKNDIFKKQRYRLRNLKTFVLCARKQLRPSDNNSEDLILGFLLKRIENAVERNATEILSFCLKLKDPGTDLVESVETYFLAKKIAFGFETDIQSSKDEINIWYSTMFNYTRQSRSLTADEVVEITESIVENLLDLPFPSFHEITVELMEALQEHMKFLKSFCHFVTKSGVEHCQTEDLLTHTEAVAIKAARLCFLCGDDNDNEEWQIRMQSEILIVLRNIKPIGREVNDTYRNALSCSQFSRRLHAPAQDMDVMKNLIDSLISILWDTLRLDTSHVVSLEDDGQELYEGLRSLRTTLEKLPDNIDEKTWGEIGAVVRDAGVLVCSFFGTNADLGLKDLLKRIKLFQAEVQEKVSQTSIFNSLRIKELGVDFLLENLKLTDDDSIMEGIRNIKTDAVKSFPAKRQDIKVNEVSKAFVRSGKIDSITTEVVGFHDEAASIKARLTRGLKTLQVIAIVGMGGVGKTTLAAKVYNDPSVVQYFHVRARCLVSQTLDKKALLLELLNQIASGKYSKMQYSKMTEDELANALRRDLSGRRYLIFLDDMWTMEAWNSLRLSFPRNSEAGSGIILTSRISNDSPLVMLDQNRLHLGPLTQGESLELLQRKLFPGKAWPPALYDLGMQIARNCKGLPLEIVTVAGLLAATDQERWKELVDSLSSCTAPHTWELSYQHLPDYLKRCLLYFVTLPKNQEVSVRRLIRLWIAEELVQKDEKNSLEDVAERYVMDLIGRNLIMVAQRSIGGDRSHPVKLCRIHDLLYDFCLEKAKKEYFFHLLKGNGEHLAFNKPCNLQRLCIHSKPEHFMELSFCNARSLRFFSQRIGRYEKEVIFIRTFKLLKVLDLLGIYLGDAFPSEIEVLDQLRYLSVRGKIRVLPSSIDTLSMLETFIVDPCGKKVSLPNTIWNLQKLKYLCIWSIVDDGGGSFLNGDLDNSSVLSGLNELSGAVFICKDSMEKQMRKFPNIRKLKCMLFKHWGATEEFQNVVLGDFPSKLESLNMLQYMEPPESIKFEFCLPESLRRLTLTRFRFPWSKMSTIGKLPNLEVLKLLEDSFSGEAWEMEEEEEFSNLTYLKLRDLQIVRWKASNDQFPCLQKLVLEECEFLQEVPSCLESTQTLEMIEVYACSDATRSLVNHVAEQLKSKGMSDLKILTRSS